MAVLCFGQNGSEDEDKTQFTSNIYFKKTTTTKIYDSQASKAFAHWLTTEYSKSEGNRCAM